MGKMLGRGIWWRGWSKKLPSISLHFTSFPWPHWISSPCVQPSTFCAFFHTDSSGPQFSLAVNDPFGPEIQRCPSVTLHLLLMRNSVVCTKPHAVCGALHSKDLGYEEMASSCARGGLDCMLGTISSWKGWTGTGAGCPGKWWHYHPWRFKRRVVVAPV